MKDPKFWILVVFASGGLVLGGFNLNLRQAVVDTQEQIRARDQYINESQQLAQFNDRFIRALAQLAVTTDDENISRLLSEHGISYSLQDTQSDTGGEGR